MNLSTLREYMYIETKFKHIFPILCIICCYITWMRLVSPLYQMEFIINCTSSYITKTKIVLYKLNICLTLLKYSMKSFGRFHCIFFIQGLIITYSCAFNNTVHQQTTHSMSDNTCIQIEVDISPVVYFRK